MNEECKEKNTNRGMLPTIQFKITYLTNLFQFHCFTVHFNSLNIMSQQMHLYVIKHSFKMS
jgi:hypothetical protein